MTTLYVLAEYRNAKEGFTPGQVIEVSPEKAAWLLKDSPGSFSEKKPVAKKEVKAPPKDKAVKRAPRSKAAKK